MHTKQQSEALNYFKKQADGWKKSADSKSQNEVNIIKQRNDFVLKVIDERKRTSSLLDVGCGTGDLVCQAAAKGVHAIGVDFAKEMIDIAKIKAKKMKSEGASFVCASIFDFPFEPDHYDVISANGFIEYISYDELDQLLELSWKALKQGGSLILGSRNRLFNVLSLNTFTQEEIDGGVITRLIEEAIQIGGSENIRDLMGFKSAPFQKEHKEHEHTGIGVSTRYQFTPAQLVNKLVANKFEPVQIYPIHIHGVTPKFKNRFPEVHGNISRLLQNYANNGMGLVAQSSSFMIHGKKSHPRGPYA